MKPYYEGLKEIGVDVDKIWRKMLDFRAQYRVVTPCFVSSHKMNPCYEGLKEIGVDVDELWRKMLGFGAQYRVVTPCFDHPIKWNPVMKVWKKLEFMLMSYEGKC